jgi:23S rRNA pseudouridine1911/1915/1917 synthase
MRYKKNAPPPPPKETRLKVNETTELMTFLLAKMGGMSRNSVKSLLAHRQVMVNNEVTTQFNLALKKNDLVVINSLRGNIELSHPKLKIIFEDQYVIVVEKKKDY